MTLALYPITVVCFLFFVDFVGGKWTYPNEMPPFKNRFGGGLAGWQQMDNPKEMPPSLPAACWWAVRSLPCGGTLV